MGPPTYKAYTAADLDPVVARLLKEDKFDGVESSLLADCAALHTLDLTRCIGVRDVSALAGCAALHTLDLEKNVSDGRVCAGGLRAAAHAQPQGLPRGNGLSLRT